MAWLSRRTVLVLSSSLAALVVVAGGCGGDGASDDRRAAAEVARQYVDALVTADGQRACDLMTVEVRRRFQERADGGECASAFESASRQLGGRQRRLLSEAEIRVDQVEGDVARGSIRVSGDVGTEVELRRGEGGRWLFATPPQGP